MNIELILARKRLTLYDAATVVKEMSSGSKYDPALGLVIEAVDCGYLPAEKDPATGHFDALRTTVATADLLAWLGSIPPASTTGAGPAKLGTGDTAEMSLTDTRVAAIVETAKKLGYKPMAIEYGGKAAIKSQCLEKMAGAPHRFTDSTFDAAWKIAAKRKLVEVEDSEMYRNK